MKRKALGNRCHVKKAIEPVKPLRNILSEEQAFVSLVS
jgi:hypothetical protein